MINGRKEMETSTKAATTTRESSPALSTWGIIKESSKLTWKNKKLMFSLTLIMIPPYTILALFNDTLVNRLMKGLDSNASPFCPEPCDPSLQNTSLDQIGKSLRILAALEFGCLFTYWVITLALMVTTIYVTATTVGIDLTGHKILAMSRRTLKQSAITWLYVFLFSISYVGGSLLLMWVVVPGGGVFISFAMLMSLVFVLLYIFLNAVWMVSIVVSVVDEDCYGMAALAEAGEIIRGRRIQGFVLMLLAIALSVAFFMASSFTATTVFQLMLLSLACPLKLFTFVSFTVFYYECRKIHGKKVVGHGGDPRAQDSRMNKNDVEANG
ncbi:uncharacterized protein LOC131256444 [Magnolia sinica]|uniref:uncharacterized protein LOC131256444 n=1 Tax=Magnolia sinica TaxID=86752 RepID=UPI00265B7120|nr:uncharacterized protein LOC131256444 [Magnolia sinica]